VYIYNFEGDNMKYLRVIVLSIMAAATLNMLGCAQQPIHGEKEKLIFQVSDADPKKWNLTLNNVKNVQQDIGKDNVDIEIVAYGPGIGMLKLDSEVGNRVAEATASGVKVMACGNTMTGQKLTKEDMLPNIGYVKAGVVELMQKQHEGYAIIRP
jgi:intracellular sulfur oxidation DsrE/DsrF family protein